MYYYLIDANHVCMHMQNCRTRIRVQGGERLCLQ